MVYKKQREILKGYHSSKKSKKEIGFAYFYKTVLSTWDNAIFALKLGKGKYRYFNVYQTRVVYENVFRLEYYINQSVKDQNNICLFEMTRIIKRFYDYTGDVIYKKYYDGTVKDLGDKNTTYPKIEEKGAYKDPFPTIASLVSNSKLNNDEDFYMHYRFLSESQHNKLMSIYIAEDPKAQYRRNISYLIILCRWLLRVVDSHIQNVTKKDVETVIKETDEIMFSINKSDKQL